VNRETYFGMQLFRAGQRTRRQLPPRVSIATALNSQFLGVLERRLIDVVYRIVCAVSIQYGRVTDDQTDGRTQGRRIYRAIA